MNFDKLDKKLEYEKIGPKNQGKVEIPPLEINKYRKSNMSDNVLSERSASISKSPPPHQARLNKFDKNMAFDDERKRSLELKRKNFKPWEPPSYNAPPNQFHNF
jgi:hypothetical protein